MSVQSFIAACSAAGLATVAIGIHMARPWGDNYAYRDASGYGVLALMLLWAVSPYAGLAFGLRLLRRSRVASRTLPWPLTTRDTVARETPARVATSSRVGMPRLTASALSAMRGA